MRTKSWLLAATTLTGLLIAGSRPAAAQAQWRPLYNGVNMNGWTNMNQGNWSVQNGYLTYTGGGNGWLRTAQEFRNFSLVATWRYTQPGNNDSGLFVRAGAEGNPWPGQGYQLNMGPGNNYGSLGGAQNAPARPELIKPQGQWNVYQLTVINDQAALAINGQEAWTDARGLTRPSGYIGFQAENRPIEIAQVWILDYGAGEFGGTGGTTTAGGFTELFNGRTMDGWTKMNQGNWMVENGVMRYTGGGNGWLRSNSEYSDYQAIVEWRYIMPGNNDSGFFNRAGLEGNPWPGQGYQVNMGPGTNFGSVGGVPGASARPDLIRPTAQWNTYDFTVIGNRGTLLINGTKAWDATGFNRPNGYLGFQAEGRPFEIRSVRIRPLK